MLSKSKIKPKLLMLDKKLKHSRIQLECFSPLARLYDIIILHNQREATHTLTMNELIRGKCKHWWCSHVLAVGEVPSGQILSTCWT